MYVSGTQSDFQCRLHQLCTSTGDLAQFNAEASGYIKVAGPIDPADWQKEARLRYFSATNSAVGLTGIYTPSGVPILPLPPMPVWDSGWAIQSGINNPINLAFWLNNYNATGSNNTGIAISGVRVTYCWSTGVADYCTGVTVRYSSTGAITGYAFAVNANETGTYNFRLVVVGNGINTLAVERTGSWKGNMIQSGLWTGI